ncbi:MAG: phosphoadenosine phosphosulfate reductase family protein, partial [Gammaproteobacteria bacterium]|nr:phosphoadenosine phosphosulfate reductase family protein [Gammaproteobacteria bacterium]
MSLVLQLHDGEQSDSVLFANDGRMGRRWLYLDDIGDSERLLAALKILAGGKNLMVWPHGQLTAGIRKLAASNGSHDIECESGNIIRLGTFAYQGGSIEVRPRSTFKPSVPGEQLSNLDQLEAESIHIMREVMAQADNPVMLYSLGKDSSVMLHLAKKAFYPGKPPFPLLHVDTRWKFQAMYQFRDEMAKSCGMDLIVHVNPDGIEKNINPFDHGSALHTDVMKTE